MKDKVHVSAAAFTFVASLIVYIVSVAPTVSLWDCGEFITCSATLGVPHPPGAPFYLLIGRFFSLLPVGSDIAYRVNLISPIASAFTVMILYLIIVKLIKEYAGSPKTLEKKLSLYAGGVVGALTFAFSDTFWFNATEAEVYAVSMLLTSLTLYLALRWMENSHELSSIRLLILCSYLFGLAVGIHLLNLLVFPSILLLIFFYNKKLFTNYRFWAVAVLILFIGCSTYILIYIRANLSPFLNENNPSNYERFMSYWNREQYGQESLFLTFIHRKAPLWAYQIKKMYLRYFAWNFMGQGTTIGPDRNIVETFSPRGLYYLPFLLGIIGLYHHFKRSWKKAFVILSMFIMTGIAIVIYLNQPDPQPRERDYVYVGSFYAFAIWIGIGVSVVIGHAARMFSRAGAAKNITVGAVLGLTIIMGPLVEFNHNFDKRDRRGNYFAWDYSYDILQSCEDNAILFTNGDNDTFPLWYLQAVEGVRTDVTIVNLSLLNTDWYIKQLKYGNPIYKPLSVSIPDDRIDGILPQQWKTQKIRLPVPAAVYNEYAKEVHEVFNLKEVQQDTSISFTVKPTMYGQGIRVQDLMILDIVYSNRWRRPVYFAMTVSPENKIGMDKYLRLDGMAFKLLPFPATNFAPDLLSRNLLERFQYRGFNNPDVYFNVQKIDLLQNIRTCFLLAGNFYWQNKMKEQTLKILEALDTYLPESVIPVANYQFTGQVAQMYFDCGRPDKMKEKFEIILQRKDINDNVRYDIAQILLLRVGDTERAREICEDILEREPYHPQAYSLMITLYEKEKNYPEAVKYLENWLAIKPNDSVAVALLKKFREKIAAPDTSSR